MCVWVYKLCVWGRHGSLWTQCVSGDTCVFGTQHGHNERLVTQCVCWFQMCVIYVKSGSDAPKCSVFSFVHYVTYQQTSSEDLCWQVRALFFFVAMTAPGVNLCCCCFVRTFFLQ